MRISRPFLGFLSVVSLLLLTFLDNGGIDYGNTALSFLIILLTTPFIVWGFNRSAKYIIIILLIFFLSLLFNHLTSGIIQGYIFRYLLFLGFLSITCTTLYIRSSSPFLYNTLINLIFIALTFTGLKSLHQNIFFGEERLWRSLPWHNQSGILAGAFLLYYLSIFRNYSSNKEIKHIFAKKIAVISLFSLSLVELYYSGSRASQILTLAMLIVFLFTNFTLLKVFIRFLPFTITFIFVSIIAFNSILGSYSDTGVVVTGIGPAVSSNDKAIIGARNSSATHNFALRVKYWKTALKIFDENKLTGAGLGSWSSIAWNYRAADEDMSTATHNDYLQILAEGGLILFVPIFLLFLLYFRYQIRLYFVEKGDNLIRAGPFILLTIHSAMDFNIRYFFVWFIASLFLVNSLRIPQDTQVISTITDRSHSPKHESEQSFSYKESNLISYLSLLPILLIIFSSLYHAAQADAGRENKKRLYSFNTIFNNSNDKNFLKNFSTFDSDNTIQMVSKANSLGYQELSLALLTSSMKSNPKDLRLPILYHEMNYYLGKETKDEFITQLHATRNIWPEGYITGVSVLFAQGDFISASKLLDEFKSISLAHPVWEGDSNISLIYIYEKKILLANGVSCDDPKIIAINKKFNYIMEHTMYAIQVASKKADEGIC